MSAWPPRLVERLRRSLVWPMLWKEFVQLRRDRLTLGMMLGIPTVQIVIFGLLVRTDVRHVPTVVLDESRTSESRALVSAMVNTRNFAAVRYVASRGEMDAELARGAARAALVIPPDYARDLKRGRTAVAQVVVDASDPLTARAAIAGAAATATAAAPNAREHGGDVVGGAAAERPAPGPAVDVRVRPRYNPALRDAINVVPGLVGVILTITLVMVMSLALVRERERGTLEQLVVTPIGKSSVILGKILPFLLVGFVQVTVVLVIGRWAIGVPVHGSLTLLYALTLLFMLGMLALGLLMSTFARTQTQALQMALFVIMPSFLLSGFMFPLAAMPVAARWLGALLPVTHFLTALRAILLKGAGFGSLWREAAILAVSAAALLALSVRRFAKTIG